MKIERPTRIFYSFYDNNFQSFPFRISLIAVLFDELHQISLLGLTDIQTILRFVLNIIQIASDTSKDKAKGQIPQASNKSRVRAKTTGGRSWSVIFFRAFFRA